jgi:hypothetical protein
LETWVVFSDDDDDDNINNNNNNNNNNNKYYCELLYLVKEYATMDSVRIFLEGGQ